VYSDDKAEQKQNDEQMNKAREAHENTLEARDEEETHTSVDRKKTGNRPRFDRDR
jgi:hypothetical protein